MTRLDQTPGKVEAAMVATAFIIWWSLHWWLQNERHRAGGAAAVFNRHFQNGETIYRQLSKRLQDNSAISAAEATAIALALNYNWHTGPDYHDVVFYSNSMPCLLAIECEDTENHCICHIMNLLWLLRGNGTHARFCWIPNNLWNGGNERVDHLAKGTLDQDIEPQEGVHCTYSKPVVNPYIQQSVQTKWDEAVHGSDLYLVKPTLGPPIKFQLITRAEEVVITWLRIGHAKATKSHILSRGPPNVFVVKHWPLTICFWCVQRYRNVVTYTTQLAHWICSSRQFPRFA